MNSTRIHLPMEQNLRCSPPAIDCKICTYPSHGLHFGVISCRACAAFFRRSLVSGLNHLCKNGDSGCRIDKSERFFCRACRFKKCLKYGMNSDKIQQNRDPISSTIQGTSDEKTEKDTEDGSDAPMFDGPLYDFQSLMEELREIFLNVELDENSENYANLSSLGKMEWGLRWLRRGQKRRYLEVASNMSFDYLTKVRCGLLKNAARFLMHSWAFREISESEKFMVLKSAWHVWARLERLSMTIEIFGAKAISEKIVFTSDIDSIHLIDVLNNSLDHLKSEELKELNRELQPLFSVIFDELGVKLLDLKPTAMETAYMLCQLVWCVAGKTLIGKSLECGERFMEQLSNDLHEYYEKDLKMEKYAVRILKMMSVVTKLQKTYINYHGVINQAESFRKLFESKL